MIETTHFSAGDDLSMTFDTQYLTKDESNNDTREVIEIKISLLIELVASKEYRINHRGDENIVDLFSTFVNNVL